MRSYWFPTEEDGPLAWPDTLGDDGDGYDRAGTRAGSGECNHQGGRRT